MFYTKTTTDMKPQIELHEATYTRNGIKVNYVLFDEAGEAIVSQTIPTESLEEYIIDEGLNAYRCGFDDIEFVDAGTFLEDNLNDVVTDYLTYNLERVAA